MNIYYLSIKPDIPANDYWAYGMLNDLLEGDKSEVRQLEPTEKAVVVIPGEYHADAVNKINTQLSKIQHVVLFIMADEEAKFPIEKIDHPSIHIWVQYPHMDRHDAYHKFGTGYPGHLKDNMQRTDKDLDVFFAGQNTHSRREELIRALEYYRRDHTSVVFKTSPGFTQGLKPAQYYDQLLKTRIAPAPSGPVTPDSFRLFEALECMCIPIGDQKTPDGKTGEYWDWLFGEITPFPKVTDWDRLFSLIPEILEDYPANLHRQTAWYIKWKRDFVYKVREQLDENL